MLLAAGVAILRLTPAPPVGFGWLRWTILAVALGAALLPAVHRRLFPLLERIRRPDDRAVGVADGCHRD